jgi:succinyl-CoA synthetase beta subunit
VKLYEYLAKQLLADSGVPIPPGRLCTHPDEAAQAVAEIGPAAVKAQVLVGGRGKAGGIRFADTPEEARAVAARILGMNLKGYTVEKVYVERRLSIERELYLSVTVDRARRAHLVMASRHGGMEIEEVDDRDIVRRTVDPVWGLMPYEARSVAKDLGLTGPAAEQVADILLKLYRVFVAQDAELVEINPLAVTGDAVIAADARLNVDDAALYRHPELPRVAEGTALEQRVKEIGLAYVELEGDIAVMANGAGMAMATLDAIQHFGGRPANFLDAGGGASVEPMAQALDVLVGMNPKVIFINIFGGITRCDDVARAIVQVKETRGIPVPLVVRLVGTNEEEGVALLRAHGISAYRRMDEAARQAVALAGEGTH